MNFAVKSPSKILSTLFFMAISILIATSCLPPKTEYEGADSEAKIAAHFSKIKVLVERDTMGAQSASRYRFRLDGLNDGILTEVRLVQQPGVAYTGIIPGNYNPSGVLSKGMVSGNSVSFKYEFRGPNGERCDTGGGHGIEGEFRLSCNSEAKRSYASAQQGDDNRIPSTTDSLRSTPPEAKDVAEAGPRTEKERQLPPPSSGTGSADLTPRESSCSQFASGVTHGTVRGKPDPNATGAKLTAQFVTRGSRAHFGHLFVKFSDTVGQGKRLLADGIQKGSSKLSDLRMDIVGKRVGPDVVIEAVPVNGGSPVEIAVVQGGASVQGGTVVPAIPRHGGCTTRLDVGGGLYSGGAPVILIP